MLIRGNILSLDLFFFSCSKASEANIGIIALFRLICENPKCTCHQY